MKVTPSMILLPAIALMLVLNSQISLQAEEQEGPCPACKAAEQAEKAQSCANCNSDSAASCSKCQSGQCQDYKKCGKGCTKCVEMAQETRTRRSLLRNRPEHTSLSPVCPVPVPAYVGHTTITYGPFMPHHLLYPHVDTYRHKSEDGKGVHRTRAAYRTSLQARMRNLQWNLRPAR